MREVPAFLSHRERKKNPSRGKSDVQDAIAIARVVARGDGLSSPQRTDAFQDLKLLSDHRAFALGLSSSTEPTRTWWSPTLGTRNGSRS
ncbi:MAG: hypothetical protein H0U17_04045 [Actinobacteria bacterium]|nr:hypothetical protein [Actinomycetota bacterium]